MTSRTILRAACLMLLTAAAACGAATPLAPAPQVNAPGAPAAPVAPARIMPIGDSITEADGGHASYRYWLYRSLVAAGYQADLVGSRRGVYEDLPLYPDFDQDHEGHWGWTTGQVLERMPEWAALNPPDAALIHLGTNDAFRNLSLDQAMTNIAGIIAALRQQRPGVKVFLAQVIGTTNVMSPNVVALNAKIPALAAQLTTSASPVVVVDQWTGFDPVVDTYDGVHPSESGEKKIAAKFQAALVAAGVVTQAASVR